jgi:hypothetical protein
MMDVSKYIYFFMLLMPKIAKESQHEGATTPVHSNNDNTISNSTMMTPTTVRRASTYISLASIASVLALWTHSGQLVAHVDAFTPTSHLRSHQPTLFVAQRPLHSSFHDSTCPLPFSFQKNPSSTIISRMDQINNPFCQTSRSCSRTALNAGAPGGVLGGYSWIGLVESLFRYSGTVPFFEALGINALLFFVLQKKLFTMLTPAGFLHSMALGTMLWSTLGW